MSDEFIVRELKRQYDLSDRFLKFAVMVITIIKQLPQDLAGKRIADQLFRAGTSSGANYEETRAAESRRDFIHKLGVVLKELRESYFWLRLIHVSQILMKPLVQDAIKESDELIRIIGASINSARKNK